ncbi:MAG TPA: biotin--[acetyl-CoA-carboxylase] ligase [Gemmatimonadales bacterium]|nr:biotin--[acetyl-CoA-carboxylase] ligase [Gemmatimonadales bacterium]
MSTPAIIRLRQTTSTMDALHELAEEGAPAGTAVVAEEQGSGRGSRGRAWASPRGGLWVSVLARPASAGLGLVSLRAGLAAAECLDAYVGGPQLWLKWPNDLMLGERKAGGILCEARWQGVTLAWVVIGLGLNVANEPGAQLAPLATHLASLHPGLRPAELAGPVIAALREVDAAAGPLTDDELLRFSSRDWLRGRTLTAPTAGVADGLVHDGSLRVRGADGSTTSVRAGTLVLAATSATDLHSCS